MIELTEKEIDVHILKAIADGESGFIVWFNLSKCRIEGYNIETHQRYCILLESSSGKFFHPMGRHSTCLKDLTP